MKIHLKRFHLFSIVVLVVSVSIYAADRLEHPRELTYPELTYSLPEVERVVLDNGLVVYLREDRRLPLVDLYAVTKVGGIYDPPEKLGLANLTGAVMRTGGTQGKTGDEIDEILEFIGASIETEIDIEKGTARASCMGKDLDTVLPLFAEILMRPEFREDKIDLRKKEVMEGIRRRNDQPRDIVSREFRQLVYGDHPYARALEGEPDTVASIARNDLLDFHKRYYSPNNTIIGVSGDFNRDEMLDRLRNCLGEWARQEVPFPDIPPLPEENIPAGGVYCYPKDLTQSNIRFGHLGIRRTDEDYIPVRIMNFILGGGSFTSRLITKVRSDEGLAYSVYSYFDPARDRGLFIAHAETKAESTIHALDLMKGEIQRICEEIVTEDELKTAKDSYLNRFVFNFTRTRDIVQQRVDLEYDGLPADYLDTFCEKVSQVTREDILRVAKKWLHADSLVILVVGDEKKFDGSLSQFGPVQVLDVRDYAAEVDAAQNR
ncbi:MAG: pitrilysin family protein [bacterium]